MDFTICSEMLVSISFCILSGGFVTANDIGVARTVQFDKANREIDSIIWTDRISINADCPASRARIYVMPTNLIPA
ncbi:MAG: hypothetical protein HN489_10000 [Opitutae bacterium]|nr:hypothetical protein [Opitutae bacterium]